MKECDNSEIECDNNKIECDSSENSSYNYWPESSKLMVHDTL